MEKKFVPDEFIIPEKLETEKFRMRMLTVNDVEKDYEAVMSSREHIRSTYDDEDDDTWPEENMTIEEDLEDLRRHQEEFLKREAFVYTVVTLDESKCLGCVYMYPSEKKEIDAEIYLWARASGVENGLEKLIFESVKKWVKKEWPFKKVAFPGLEPKWDEWKRI
ncbi:hypothetical protein [Clostridium oryzae]|uniref:N-acetyltransferase domain-containing protein n=1 Tax=Clostridium oryzae TaxID=1450648 RepID=A0A1V4IWM8_9CLOT|nr:hypothetical protein [Clostridium oryzae]OPJ63827.1 hypothetical protein CLORY_10110 [Clostridium oryzae]